MDLSWSLVSAGSGSMTSAEHTPLLTFHIQMFVMQLVSLRILREVQTNFWNVLTIGDCYYQNLFLKYIKSLKVSD